MHWRCGVWSISNSASRLRRTFGGGTASSSDGQFFQAAGFGRAAGRLNAHYGQQPGFKVYTHLSDRYGPFFTKLIAATASEALHVLDALLYHQSEVAAAAAPHRRRRRFRPCLRALQPCWASSSRRASRT